MENFIVSARKYRPTTFDTVVGQDSITRTLKNAIKNQQLAQAFLFCGPRGVGKTTCARILAKTINCLNPTDNIEPCNECESCVSFSRSASFNIHELDAASNNSVDDIRNLVDQVRIPPQVGRYKVYIIDEVHMLSSSAFNAFLKTLEEPPPYAKFILATTEKHKIIPTILSRCQIFDFRRITVQDISNYLAFVAGKEGIKASDEALHIIAQKADGAMRDALSIFDQLVSLGGKELTYEMVIEHLNVLDYTYYFTVTDQVLAGDTAGILLTINEIIDRGFDGQHFLIGMGEHLRNLLVCKDGSTVKLLEVSDNIKARYASQSEKAPEDFLIKALDISNQADINYKNSNNKRLLLELALIRMAPPAEGTPSIEKKKVIAPGNKEEKKKPVPAPGQAANPVPASAPPATKKTESAVKTSPGPSLGPRTISIRPENHKKDTGKGSTPGKALTEDFNQEKLEKVWNYFTESIGKQYPNFYSSVAGKRLALKENFIVSLTLDNKLQELEVTHKRQEILDFLRDELSNHQVNLEIEVIESNGNGKPYSPEEKFRAMAEKNPLIRELKDKLDLEIDY